MTEVGYLFITQPRRFNYSKSSSAQPNTSDQSQEEPVKSIFRKSRKSNDKSDKSTIETFRDGHTSLPTTSSSLKTTSEGVTNTEHDRMPSTPLTDYKHPANQTAKSRAAAQASQTQRKSSTTSGTSSERRNALQAVESRTASTTRGEQPGRTGSISSSIDSSAPTAVTSSKPPSIDTYVARPFTRRNGRKYLRDPTLPYPLSCDLTEIHRQTLRTMLLCQVFNGPLCSRAFDKKPPKRVLEVACGTGFWSVMCHRHFALRGFTSTAFRGIDIAPLAPSMDADDDMDWKFIQHDVRQVPLPFRDEEFDLVMIKDLSMVTSTNGTQQSLMDDVLRILVPGGTLEIWDGDHSLRMLLPHAPPATREDGEDREAEEQVYTNAMGIYTLTQAIPLAAPQNQYLQDYNSWISKALEPRGLSPVPCTSILPLLRQETESLGDIKSRRLAIPLGEVRWEREGVGGAIAQGQNGATHNAILSKGKAKETDRKLLTPGQAALRRTALITVVQMIESLEPLLKEVSGKGQDEWDRWQGNMMNDLLKNNGTSWGECLEVGAWWGRKK